MRFHHRLYEGSNKDGKWKRMKDGNTRNEEQILETKLTSS